MYVYVTLVLVGGGVKSTLLIFFFFSVSFEAFLQVFIHLFVVGRYNPPPNQN